MSLSIERLLNPIEITQTVPSAARNANGTAPAGKSGSATLTVFAASGTAPSSIWSLSRAGTA